MTTSSKPGDAGGPQAARPLRLDASTRDPHELLGVLESAYGHGIQVQSSEREVSGVRIRAVAHDGVAVQRLALGAVVDSTSDVLDAFVMMKVERGRWGGDGGGRHILLAAGESGLMDPDRAYAARLDRVEVVSLFLERARMDAVRRQVAPWTRSPLRCTERRPATPTGQRLWDATFDAVTREALADDVLLGNDLLRAAVLHQLGATAIAAFGLIEHRDERAASATAAHRAARFIDEHLAEPITVGDVAEAVGLSERGLRSAFSRALDTTPAAYLRRARLDAARQALLAADPGTTGVAAVAAAWGFGHLGRFAGQYRAMFGELPGETLRR